MPPKKVATTSKPTASNRVQASQTVRKFLPLQAGSISGEILYDMWADKVNKIRKMVGKDKKVIISFSNSDFHEEEYHALNMIIGIVDPNAPAEPPKYFLLRAEVLHYPF